MINRTSTTYSKNIQASLEAGDRNTQKAVVLLNQDVAVIQSLLATDWNRSLVEKILTWWRHQLDTLPEAHDWVKRTDRVSVSVYCKADDPESIYADVTFYAKHGTYDTFPWNSNGTLCKLEFQYSKGRRDGYIDHTAQYFR